MCLIIMLRCPGITERDRCEGCRKPIDLHSLCTNDVLNKIMGYVADLLIMDFITIFHSTLSAKDKSRWDGFTSVGNEIKKFNASKTVFRLTRTSMLYDFLTEQLHFSKTHIIFYYFYLYKQIL